MSTNKNSKIISIVLLSVIAVATVLIFLIPPLLTEKYDDELIIYNWADYIDLDVLDTFAEYYYEKTGRTVKVTYTNFDTNETMLTEIIRGDSKIDIICPSEYAIEKLLRNNVLEKFDFSEVAKYDTVYAEMNVNADIRAKIDSVFKDIPVGDGVADMNDYFLPYMWGTVGILYNTNFVTEEQVRDAGWGILWNDSQIADIEGKILAKDSIRDIYVAAVGYLQSENRLPAGYEDYTIEELINCTDPALVVAAEEILKEQKKHLKGYEVDFGKDDMVMGTALVDLAWSGDAMYAIEEAVDDDGNSYLDYYVPESGSNIWFDGWVMPKNAKNKFPAYMFMNYLCRPDIAMYNTIAIGYTSAESVEAFLTEDEADPNYEYAVIAREYLAENYDLEEFFDSEVRYPDIAESENLGMMMDFGASNESIVEMWERVKAHGETENWAILGAIIGIIAAVTILAVVLIIVKFKKPPKARKITEANQ